MYNYIKFETATVNYLFYTYVALITGYYILSIPFLFYVVILLGLVICFFEIKKISKKYCILYILFILSLIGMLFNFILTGKTYDLSKIFLLITQAGIVLTLLRRNQNPTIINALFWCTIVYFLYFMLVVFTLMKLLMPKVIITSR